MTESLSERAEGMRQKKRMTDSMSEAQEHTGKHTNTHTAAYNRYIQIQKES